MSEEIKLYDIRERNYPNKRGDHFRSIQVFECPICGSINNEVIMGGWPGYGVRTRCLYSHKCWHHELELKLLEVIDSFDGYPEDFKEKIKELREQHKDNIKNDIIGEPNFDLRTWVTNSWSYEHGSDCSHRCIFFFDTNKLWMGGGKIRQMLKKTAVMRF